MLQDPKPDLLRRELFVPFERVLGSRVMRRVDAVASSPRLAAPAVSWPRPLRVGCWGVGERRQLWAVRDGRDGTCQMACVQDRLW